MVAATAGAFYQKVFCVEEDPRSGVALQAIGGFLPALVLAALTEPMVIVWRFETIASLIWAVFALSFAASALFFLMIRAGAVAEVSSLLFLMQPLVALQAWALLGERFTLAQGAGFALTVLGVYLAMRRAPA
jgi:drug/metabolite transporter (DMT)-like permease